MDAKPEDGSIKDCPTQYYFDMIDELSKPPSSVDDSRFVPFASRELKSDVVESTWRKIQKGKEKTSWNGVSMLKDPFAFALYPMLIKELQPGTIIENGTYTGASGHWLGTIVQAFGLPTKVYSMDFQPDLRDPSTDHPNVTYLQGDLTKPAEAWPVELLSQMAHPILMIEDAHTNMGNVLKHLEANLFQKGDYVIIEDTFHIDGLYTRLARYVDMKDSEGWAKYKVVDGVFNCDKYAVDSKYCDFYGYNATYNWNTVFKVMK